MDASLAIVVYHCEIDGARTGSVDVQVRYFDGHDLGAAERRLLAEPPHSYQNDAGKVVAS